MNRPLVGATRGPVPVGGAGLFAAYLRGQADHLSGTARQPTDVYRPDRKAASRTCAPVGTTGRSTVNPCEEGVIMSSRRLWILLLLVAVFSMHGTQYVPPEPGAGRSPTATAEHGMGASSAGAWIADSGAAADDLRPTAATAQLAAVVGNPTPADAPDHGGAGHFWSLCLAVLLAGLLVLSASGVTRRAAAAVLRTRERDPRLPMRWLRPPRPPELSSLCLLRI